MLSGLLRRFVPHLRPGRVHPRHPKGRGEPRERHHHLPGRRFEAASGEPASESEGEGGECAMDTLSRFCSLEPEETNTLIEEACKIDPKCGVVKRKANPKGEGLSWLEDIFFSR